jgi:uncharacterized alkaline shock family protein YloU
MDEVGRTAYGKIEIDKEALATIAGSVTVRGYGIVGMVARGLKQGVAEILGKDVLSQGVEVVFEVDKVKIDLWVVMCYGVKIAEVARSVQETVYYEVEKMTGLQVLEVNINVAGVRVFK